MVLQLYGAVGSTCTKRVAVVLKEKKVPFEFHPIDLSKGEHKAPAFVAKQPFGQVPFIDDDGFILFESRAIARYINEKYANQGTQLVPKDIKARALFEQAASIELSNFDIHAYTLAVENIFKKAKTGLPADEYTIKNHLTLLGNKLDVYEKVLSKQTYVAGNELTLADLFHLPYGTLLGVQGYNLLEDGSRPNVTRWWKDISSRPSWLAVKDGVKSDL